MQGWARVPPLTAGNGVREVARTVLLSANVADTARIKGEHRRLGEGGEGGGGSGWEPFFEPEERTTKNWDLFAKRKFFGFDPASY